MVTHKKDINLEKKEIMMENEIEQEIHYYSLLKEKPYSIQQIARRKKELIVPKEGLPDTGTRPDGSGFFDAAMKLKVLNEETDPEFQTEHPEYRNELGGGDPMKSTPFPGVADAVMELLNSNILSQYPTPEGDYEVRNKVLRYLKQEKFSNKLTEDNIIFSVSTTHAFNLVCTLVLRPYDVVLFEAPTYGLFTFSPERVGGITRFYPLYKNENWSFEPQRLEKLIDQINEELRVSYEGILNYEPRVSMIYQTNPQNPIGRVISKQDIKQLRDVLSVCHNKGVLYVDDLIYKDLSYEKDVFPAMGIEGFESDVITLLGASKSYGLAGIRSGVIVADEIIVRGIKNLIFQTIDSPPQLQTIILGELFNDSVERNRKYDEYFKPLLTEYQHRFAILRAGVEGVIKIDNLSERAAVYDDIKQYFNNHEKEEKWLEGIPFVKLAEGCDPESGFFALLDLTELLGKKYDTTVIKSEEDIMLFLYKVMNIKYVPGAYMAWPNKQQCVARISFAVERDEIIFFIQCLKDAIERLE